MSRRHWILNKCKSQQLIYKLKKYLNREIDKIVVAQTDAYGVEGFNGGNLNCKNICTKIKKTVCLAEMYVEKMLIED